MQNMPTNELIYFLQTPVVDIDLPNLQMLKSSQARYDAYYYEYALSSGTLKVLAVILYLPSSSTPIKIESLRKSVVKSVLSWQQRQLSSVQETHNTDDSLDVLTLDIRYDDGAVNRDVNLSLIGGEDEVQRHLHTRFSHHFDVRYFLEELVLDFNEITLKTQIFSWQDWDAIVTTTQTPSDLWQFLQYHAVAFKDAIITHELTFASIEDLLAQFMSSDLFFADAIAIDNELIKEGIQDKPNAALVTMTLAQKNNNATGLMYQQHMHQAATLWSQLCTQMIDAAQETHSVKHQLGEEVVTFSHWQQQVLSESLFSRHELVRILYRHPKQSKVLQENGYVVHHHSYESLGRHYVMIFYSESAEGQQTRAAIQPNLQKIALDTATRLPIAQLHHVIILGIAFIDDKDGQYLDMDLWIQPVTAMTQKERQLTKQLAHLQQSAQHPQHPIPKQPRLHDTALINNSATSPSDKPTTKLPRVHLNVFVPAKKKDI